MQPTIISATGSYSSGAVVGRDNSRSASSRSFTVSISSATARDFVELDAGVPNHGRGGCIDDLSSETLDVVDSALQWDNHLTLNRTRDNLASDDRELALIFWWVATSRPLDLLGAQPPNFVTSFQAAVPSLALVM